MRAKSKAKDEAHDAARAQSKGKTLDQLKELVAAEYSARGIDIAPSVVAFNAEMLQVEQQPFGRARSALKAIRMVKSGGADMIRLIKNASQGDAIWLQPPSRASYPVHGGHRYVVVELEASAHDWLARVWAEAPRRMGLWVLVDVWLTRESFASQLIAHIGEQRVGTIRQADVSAFDQIMSAAALFDEDPFLRGRLLGAQGSNSVVLEVPLPAYEAG